jgi:hypothetical protein
MMTNNDEAFNQAMKKHGEKFCELISKIGHLQQLHKKWQELCIFSIESGVPSIYRPISVATELQQRLEIIHHDVTIGIKLLECGIFQEKASQKAHDVYIYATFPIPAEEEMREIMRQLDLVKEELALKEAVVAAANRRQQEQGEKLQNEPVKRPQDSNGSFVSESTEPTVGNGIVDNRHIDPLSKNYCWLLGKVLAPGAAAYMFQQGAITWKELEAIRSSTAPTQSADTLIKILMESPYDVFRCFKMALKKTEQHDVYLTLSNIGKLTFGS